jgi:methyl-accepting chemotaxis protein
MSIADDQTPSLDVTGPLHDDTAQICQALSRNQAVVEFDVGGLVLSANDNFLALFGYNLGQVLGQHHSMFCPPGTQDSEDYQAFWAALRKGRQTTGEFLRLAADGRNLYIQSSYNPVVDEAGNVLRIVKFANDITALKAKSLEDEGKISAIARTQIVIEFDLEGQVLSANDLFLRAMGYTLEEIKGHHHRMFCTPEHAQSEDYRNFWADLRRGLSRTGEFMRVHHQGHPVWLQATYTPIQGVDGRPYKVVKFATNVSATKMKSIEDDGKVAAISRSQGVVEFDLAGNVLAANDNFLKLMEYSLEEVVGQHHRLFVDRDEVNSGAHRTFWRKLANGEFDTGEYLRYGKLVWIQASYNPILDLDGRPIKIVKFCTDITGNKLAAIETQARMDAVSSSNCIIELNRDGEIMACNDVAQAALGYSSSELTGKPETMIFYDEDKNDPRHLETWRTLREGRAVSGEIRRKGAGNREVWLSATLSPVVGIDGLLNKVVLIAQDESEAKTSRLDAEGKLGAIDRAQAVVEFDLAGRVLKANENFL